MGLSPCSDLASDKELTFALFLGIQVTWFREDIDTGIKTSIIQSYAVLLSTLLTINRRQLSLCDVEYALLITTPPLMVYLMISSICDLLGMKTGLYKRIRSDRRITRALGVLIMPLWLALSLTQWLSRRAFEGSEQGGGLSLRKWFLNVLYYLAITLNGPYPGTAAIFSPFFAICLCRRLPQVKADTRAARGGTPGPCGGLRWAWTFVGCAWYVSVVVGA